MSESEIAQTSTSSSRSTVDLAEKKKFVNSQTQHGNAMTADEENIVVLGQSFSPVRESSDEVVWHEDVIEPDQDVSKIQSYYISRYSRWKVSNIQLFSQLPLLRKSSFMILRKSFSFMFANLQFRCDRSFFFKVIIIIIMIQYFANKKEIKFHFLTFN